MNMNPVELIFDRAATAARDLNTALEAEWSGFEIGGRIPLADIARAHELVEHPVRRGGWIVVVL
jgi:hypothetical protein